MVHCCCRICCRPITFNRDNVQGFFCSVFEHTSLLNKSLPVNLKKNVLPFIITWNFVAVQWITAKCKQKYQVNIPNCRVVVITLFMSSYLMLSSITNKFEHWIEPKTNSQSISANLIKSNVFFSFCSFCDSLLYFIWMLLIKSFLSWNAKYKC